MQIPFIGQTYNGRSKNIAADRSINFYPEIGPDDSKSPFALIGTPGTQLFCNIGDEPIRGMAVFNDTMFVVMGASLYSVDRFGAYTYINQLSTTNGRVSMSNNGLSASGVGGDQLCIVDGVNTYIYNVISGAWTVLVNASSMVTYIDTYFVHALANSMAYQVSNIYDGTDLPSLAKAAVSATPDPIKAVMNLNNQLWFIKERSSEVHYNTKTSVSLGSPFSRISGAVFSYGTIAPWSVAIGADSILFLAYQRNNDSSEFVGVARSKGSTIDIISPAAINYYINSFPYKEDAFAYCYSEDGHTFYVLTFPSSSATLVFDLTTEMWHERSTYNGTSAVRRHIGNCYCYFQSKHYVGDYRTGKIYEMSSSFYSDNGDPIISRRITQHGYDSESLDLFTIHKLTVDIESGVGNSDDTSPVASLSWSNDGGHNFSSEYDASIGAEGNFRQRLVWRRLGVSRDRVWSLTMAGKHKKVVLGAYAEVS